MALQILIKTKSLSHYSFMYSKHIFWVLAVSPGTALRAGDRERDMQSVLLVGGRGIEERWQAVVNTEGDGTEWMQVSSGHVVRKCSSMTMITELKPKWPGAVQRWGTVFQAEELLVQRSCGRREAWLLEKPSEGQWGDDDVSEGKRVEMRLDNKENLS